jgi:hypothetical protein
MAQRIGRVVVRSEPEVFFKADGPCVLTMFVPSKRLDEDLENPVVAVQIGTKPRPPYGDEESAILPFNWGLAVRLEAGEEVWAVSSGESMISFSVIPEVSR